MMCRAFFLAFFLLISSHASAFCFEEAGRLYNVSPELLKAIAKVESNYNPEAVNYNANGSYDYGLMQINTFWAPSLGPRWDDLKDPCYNVMVGSWILAQCFERHGVTWNAVGCYNSSKPVHRKKYAHKVFQALNK